MNIDFHTHGKLSKKTPFSLKDFSESMKEAKQAGLDAIALTEHFNAHHFKETYEQIDDTYTYQSGHYMVEGIKVFPGVEVDAKEGGHFLFIGHREDIREFVEKLQPYLTKENFLPIADLFALSVSFNFLKIGAHPFRESNPLTHHDHFVFGHLDAVDLNGKDIYKYGRKMKETLQIWAYQKDLPIVAGSDTHQHLQYGCVYNTFVKDCKNVEELKEVIQLGHYDFHISPHLEVQVKAASKLKKVLKASLVGSQ
ncbi:PHP domain-containing protein [Alkalihalobacillus trypoxylicola]|uniref:Polymerase/histidinol phosphatase N-terminal domain-containing protein n=1 Tax=Alkalihalobacillus trypoxylicola TaxID=519424 RepID=A0A162EW01_9BACI|nr:PHP domain-containing protein [Alkalihalobacillus trypoxylicola]KYG33867.1 hypothetical protein AZF04_15235 [Alkalihalobacillus trypoxylicola]